MSAYLHTDTVEDIVPLPDPQEPDLCVPDRVGDWLFDRKTNEGAPIHAYALLDATLTPFLEERLVESGLPHECLYTDMQGQELTAVAPWLVQLTPEAKLTRQLFSHHPDDADPFDLLPKRPGLFVLSPLDAPDLRDRLRRLTMVPNESGFHFFFRFFEPGMLQAALRTATEQEVASVFRDVTEVLWMSPQLDAERWRMTQLRPLPGLPEAKRMALVIDEAKRLDMRHAVHLRRAETMARAEDISVPEREVMSRRIARLMDMNFEDDTGLHRANRLMTEMPADHLPEIWKIIESNKYSLGYINWKIATHYGLDLKLT